MWRPQGGCPYILPTPYNLLWGRMIIVDLKAIKKFVCSNNAILSPKTLITKEHLQIFSSKTALQSKIILLFDNKTGTAKNPIYYKVEWECFYCGSIKWKELSKTYILKYIHALKKKDEILKKYKNSIGKIYLDDFYACQKCIDLEMEKEKKNNADDAIIKKENIKIRNNNDKGFIKTFLNPNMSLKPGTLKEAFSYLLHNIRNCNSEVIVNRIQKMPYKQFLKTPYWTAISNHVRFKAYFKCSLCSSGGVLHVHHKNYNRRGYEHIYWKEDLIALCASCHQKFHNKKDKG